MVQKLVLIENEKTQNKICSFYVELESFGYELCTKMFFIERTRGMLYLQRENLLTK